MLLLQLLLQFLTYDGVFGNHDHRDLNPEPRERRQAGPSYQGPLPCASKFYHRNQHSACQPRSPKVSSSGVSASDVTLIVSEHNRYRGLVQPPAANMLKMAWDEEVALVAQSWADTCSFSHEPDHTRRDIPGRFGLGQNIGHDYTDWSSVIKAWNDESAKFVYGDSSMDHPTSFVVGHYTQIVWATSSLVGCGFADCQGKKFYVCNYGPAGNVGGQKRPYINGSRSCQDCPNSCVSNLCDCGTVNCQNDGSLNVSNCHCTCSQTFYSGTSCELECEGLREPAACGKAPFDKAGCSLYANAPALCPNLCDVCPYADRDYVETGHVTSSPSSVGVRLSASYLSLVLSSIFFV